MTISGRLLFASALIAAMGALASPAARAQTRSVPAPAAVPSLQGVWTLNAGASDVAPPPQRGSDQARPAGAAGPAGGGANGPLGNGGRRGAFAPRPAAGTGPGGPGAPLGTDNPQAAARLQQAMNTFTTPPTRLTIVQTDSAIVVTTNEGKTTRLFPTGKGIKDDNTKTERKTKWDSGKLVSQIDGLGPDTLTERYWVDTDTHQLHVQLTIPNRARSTDPTTLNRLYDIDPAAAK